MAGIKIKIDVDEAERASKRLRKELKELGNEAVYSEKDFKKLEARLYKGMEADKAKKSIDSLQRSLSLTRRETARMQNQVGDYSGSMRTMMQGVVGVTKKVALMGAALTAAAVSAGAMAYAAKRASDVLWDTGLAYQRNVKALEEIKGSASSAAEELDYLRDVSDRYGQNLYALLPAYKGFLASTSKSGMALKDTHVIFEGVTKSIASMGLTAHDAGRVMYAFQQMVSKDMKGIAEEVNQQLGEVLPGAFGMFAKAVDKSEKELRKMMETGDLNLDHLVKFGAYLGQEFSGEVAEAVRASNQFNQAWEDLKIEMGDSGFMESATSALNDLTVAFKDPEVKAGLKVMAEYLGKILELTAQIPKAFAGDQDPIGTQIQKTTKDIQMLEKSLESLKARSNSNDPIVKIKQADVIKRMTGQLNQLNDELSVLQIAATNSRRPILGLSKDIEVAGGQMDDTREQVALLETRIKSLGEAWKQGVTTEEYYKYMQDQYKQDEEAFIKATGNKEAAAGLSLKKLQKLNQEMYADAIKTAQDMPDDPWVGSKEAADAMQEYRDKEAEAIKRNIDLQNRMAEAIEDTYSDGSYDDGNFDYPDRTEDFENESDMIKTQTQEYQTMFNAISGYFDENSSEREAMHNAEIAFAGIELALNLQKAISNAVVSVTSAGQGDPYTAIPRVVAMAALMAAYLSQIGGSLGGGGGGESSEPVKAKSITGSILGDSLATSESIQNSQEFLEDMHLEEYTELKGIHEEMRDLNTNITGLVSNLFLGGVGFTSADMGINTSTVQSQMMNNWDKSQTPYIEGSKYFDSLSYTTSLELAFAKIVDELFGGGNSGPTQMITEWASEFGGDIISGALGGNSKNVITAQGISSGAIDIGSLLSGTGMDATAFVDYYTKTQDPLWGGSSKKTQPTVYGELGDTEETAERIDDMFTKIFTSLSNSFVSLSDILGADIETVESYVFQIGKIDLQNLESADEINEAISAYINNMSDEAAYTLFGDLIGMYQQTGEGMLETAIRVSTEKIIVIETIDKLGNAFSDADIPNLAIEFSQGLLEVSGGLENFIDITSAYYEAFFSDAEKQANIKDSLVSSLGSVGAGLPGSRDAYRSLIEGVDTSTASGQELFIKLLEFSETADTYYKYLEKQSEAITNLEIQALTALGEDELADEITKQIKLNGMDEALRPMQEFIWAIEDAAESADDFTDTFNNIQTTIDSIMGGGGMGVQSKEYFQGRYSSLLSDAKSDSSKVTEFTSFANSYLDFISDYGDPGAMEQVLNDLFALQNNLEDPVSMADEITGGKTLADLYEILAQTENWDPGNSAIETMVYDAYAGIGRTGIGTNPDQIKQEGFDYWVNALTSGSVTPSQFQSTFSEASGEWVLGPNGWVKKDEYSFADGGVMSGPASGYTVPMTLHGIERIVPESDFQDVKVLLQQLVAKGGKDGDIQVKVFVGNKELKSITAEIVRTDPETQSQIRRVARV